MVIHSEACLDDPAEEWLSTVSTIPSFRGRGVRSVRERVGLSPGRVLAPSASEAGDRGAALPYIFTADADPISDWYRWSLGNNQQAIIG